jgi:hypothetical protein
MVSCSSISRHSELWAAEENALIQQFARIRVLDPRLTSEGVLCLNTRDLRITATPLHNRNRQSAALKNPQRAAFLTLPAAQLPMW